MIGTQHVPMFLRIYSLHFLEILVLFEVVKLQRSKYVLLLTIHRTHAFAFRHFIWCSWHAAYRLLTATSSFYLAFPRLSHGFKQSISINFNVKRIVFPLLHINEVETLVYLVVVLHWVRRLKLQQECDELLVQLYPIHQLCIVYDVVISRICWDERLIWDYLQLSSLWNSIGKKLAKAFDSPLDDFVHLFEPHLILLLSVYHPEHD